MSAPKLYIRDLEAIRGTPYATFRFSGATGDAWATDATANMTRTFPTADGRQVMRMAMAWDGNNWMNASQALSPTLNLNGKYCILRFKLREEDGTGAFPNPHVGAVGMRYNNAGDGTLVSGVNAWAIGSYLEKGWIEAVFDDTHVLTATNSTTTRLGQVSKWWMSPSTGGGNYSGHIEFAQKTWYTKPTVGTLMLRLDDSRATQAALLDAADAVSIKISLGIIAPRVLAGNAGQASPATVRDWYRRGHPPFNHCGPNIVGYQGDDATNFPIGWGKKTFPANDQWTTLAEKRAEVLGCIAAMEELGIERFARYLVVPGGFAGIGDATLIDEGTIDGMWYVGFNTHRPITGYYVWPPTPLQVRHFNALDTGFDTATAQQMKDAIDAVIANKRTLVAVAHSPNAAAYTEMLQYAAQKRDEGVLQIKNGSDLISPNDEPGLSIGGSSVAFGYRRQ